MAEFKGTGVIKPQFEGGLALYKDAGCTQPISDITEMDFGEAGQGDEFSKQVLVYCRNEANYPVSYGVFCDNRDVRLSVDSPLPEDSGFLDVGNVVPMTLTAKYAGSGSGSVSFVVTIKHVRYQA